MGTLVSADLQSSDPSSYRGCFDLFDPESGLLGWALDLRNPVDNLSLRFQVDGVTAFEFMTAYPRPDVSVAIGEPDSNPGFCIPIVELRRLEYLVTLRPTAEFSVEIGTTSLFLPRPETLPTLKAVVSSLVERQRSNRQEADTLERLAQARQESEPLAALPLRPFDETRGGFIEAICTEDQGSDLTWVIGWTSAVDLHGVPIMLVDGRKFPGAILACKYPRADLPVGSAGFVGVIYSSWRIRQTSRPIVYFGDPIRQHFISIPDLPRVPKQDILGYTERHRGDGDRARWADLLSLLMGRDAWLSRPGDQPDVQVGVDRLILLPHFGCFISGWVLSYTRAVEGFALKVGLSTMSMDRASLVFRPRPDLVSAFPGIGSLTDRAGFTGFFPGYPDLSTSEMPLLKVLLEHGRSTIHSVGVTLVRRLNQSESLESLLHLFPNLETERFFPSLVTAVRQEYLSRCTALDVDKFVASKRTLAVVLPSNRDDCFLVFDDIRHNVPRHLDSDTGIIFLTSQEYKHSEVPILLRQLRDDLQIPCSLVSVPEIKAALYVLRDILLMAGTDRFCYVAANDVLTAVGWERAARFLRSNDSRVLSFESIDPETLLKSRRGGSSFACNWSVFSRLCSRLEVEVESQPSSLVFLKNILQESEDIVEGGTFFMRVATPGRVALLINRFGRETTRDFAT